MTSCGESVSELDKTLNEFCECQNQMWSILEEADEVGFTNDPEKHNELSKKASDKSSECQKIVNKFLEGKDKEVVQEFNDKLDQREDCD